jgi:AIR synthase-related protein
MLLELTKKLRESRGIAHKRDIQGIARLLEQATVPGQASILIGDDCAAIPDGDGFLLLSIEGFLNEFVDLDPWFAGYCAIMVNASDIYSMGGRPIAVVDALWANGLAPATPILEGLTAAARVYGIPVVGGHTNTRSSSGQLAAAILGRASSLLTSFDARPGQSLVAAVDLRGRFREPANYWDASTPSSTNIPPLGRLRADLELLPKIAETGLCRAAKDISMGGVVGSALMLLECSAIGGTIRLDQLPVPPGVALERWLYTFPSYGFVLSVDAEHVEEVIGRFTARDLNAAVIGETDSTGILSLQYGQQKERFWDLNQSGLIGFAPAGKESISA